MSGSNIRRWEHTCASVNHSWKRCLTGSRHACVTVMTCAHIQYVCAQQEASLGSGGDDGGSAPHCGSVKNHFADIQDCS